VLPLDDPATTIDRAIIHAGQRRTRRAGKSTITSCGIETEDYRIDNVPARIAKEEEKSRALLRQHGAP
jgi:hypothetical protein